MRPPLRWAVALKHGVDVNLTRADPTTGRIDVRQAPRRVSDFDRNAAEEAIRLRETLGGTVTAVSVGPTPSREALREALAMGADEAVLLELDAEVPSDSGLVAAGLAAFFRSPTGRFDLALFGDGSTDHFSGTVGPRVAALLGLPSLTNARRVEVEGGAVRAVCDRDRSVEELEAGLPAVVTVGQEINTPRSPNFLARAKASQREIRTVPIASLGLSGPAAVPAVVLREASVPRIPRKKIPVSGDTPSEISERLLTYLRQEGIGGP